MINENELTATNFYESKCYKKLSNVLFVSYYREHDNIRYMQPVIFNITSNVEIKEQLHKDYENIREYFMNNNTLKGSSKVGIYLQNRTKGQGKDAPKTRAFYLKTRFIMYILKINIDTNI
jgi:DNA mismatch repair protein MutH